MFRTARRPTFQFSVAAMFLVLFVVAAVVAIWTHFLAPVEASAILRVRRTAQSNWQDYVVFKETQAQLVQSDYVVNKVLQEPRVQKLLGRADKDTVPRLKQQLSVDLAGNSEIIHVRFADWNGDRARQILDAIIQAYMDEIVLRERAEKLTHLYSLKQQLSRFQQDLNATSESTRRKVADDHWAETVSQSIDERRAEINSLELELQDPAPIQVIQPATVGEY